MVRSRATTIVCQFAGFLTFLYASFLCLCAKADDWPQWRHDECRSGTTSMTLPSTLYLQWRRDMPTSGKLFPSRYPGLDYCRPVQLGKTLVVSLMANDSVTAYDTDTGAQKWRYYASGVVRRPPVAMALTGGVNVVIFGSDDGYVYCLNIDDGSERWKFRAAPNSRKAMGFGRLSSVWPVFGSPVAYQGKVYFAAGYLSSWGVYAFCLDAATGSVVWRNDGGLMGGGQNSTLAPLAFSSDHTKLFGTQNAVGQPWVLDAATGEHAGYTGLRGVKYPQRDPYWYIDGSGVNQEQDPIMITVGGQTITSTNATALGVTGGVGSLLAGDGKLFVWTTTGSLYCFAGTQVTPTIYPYQTTPLSPVSDGWTTAVQAMLSRSDLKEGVALVWGVGSGRLVEELAMQATNMMVVAADPDPAKLRAIRVKMDAAGWSGARVSTISGNPMDAGFAPYQAALIVSEDITVAGYPAAGADFDTQGQAFIRQLYRDTRPFGGEIWLPSTDSQHSVLSGWVTGASLPLCDTVRRTGFTGIGAGGMTQIRRLGLPDEKQIPKPPYGVAAFGVDDFDFTWPASGSLSYGVLGGRDLYTLLPRTSPGIGYNPPQAATNARSNRGSVPAAYSTVVGWRGTSAILNTLYGFVEQSPAPAVSVSCANNHQYGDQFLMTGKYGASIGACVTSPTSYRGAVRLLEIMGCFPIDRSLAWDGAALFQSAFGCECTYGMPYLSMALVSAEDEENYYTYRGTSSSSLQPVQEMPIKRMGVNLGGPGEQYAAEEQQLWTSHPSCGRIQGYEWQTPLVQVTYRGTAKARYRYSAQMETRAVGNHNWVSASQVTGMDGLTVPLATPLVALRTATPPAVDGSFADACWDTQGQVNLPPRKREDRLANRFQYGCDEGTYAMLRYDDTNLYIAGGLHEDPAFANIATKYMLVSLCSRDQLMPPVVLFYDETGGRLTGGISNSAWQAACKTAASGAGDSFRVEMAVPWAVLEAAGLWKEQLVMNLNVCGVSLFGKHLTVTPVSANFADLANYAGPLCLDAVRGPVTETKSHTVKLYFAEMEDKAEGARVFDVKLQGQTVLSGLDVVTEAGGVRRELVKEFKNIGIADKLDIDFTRKAGEPMLSGVEVAGIYGDSPNLQPVALLDASVVSGTAPLAVTFSAKRSYDPDGQIMEEVWETGDGRIGRGAEINHIFAEPGVYKVHLLVMDNRGAISTRNVIVTVLPGQPSAFVCKIRASGGDYTNLSTWEAAMRSDLTSTQSLLFTVSSSGTYAAADDGQLVTFTGGGTGTLKHINGSNVAYVASCSGTIQPGTVTAASGHTFTISGAGSQVYTIVAECYNDWPSGLSDSVTFSGWITDGNHCAAIRPAAGQGHTGKLKTGSVYSGFALATNRYVDASAAAYTRIERVILAGTNNFITVGQGGSVNRVIGNVTTKGADYATVANSAGVSFIACGGTTPAVGSSQNVLFLNCTAKNYKLGGSMTVDPNGNRYRSRAVNCLAIAGGAGFGLITGGYSETYLSREFWLDHGVSADGTATTFDDWKSGRDGNMANQAITLVDIANGDYHLANADTGARNRGLPGLGADIDGQERTGPSYDVGADQNTSAVANYPAITSSLTATGSVGAAFSYDITALNSPMAFSAAPLPVGLSIDAAGHISGTPAAAGTVLVTLCATNASGTCTATLALTIGGAAPSAPVITSASAAAGQVGCPFAYAIMASTPSAYGASNLPAGLSLNPLTGIISGIPAATGTNSVTLQATNAAGQGTMVLTLAVSMPPLPVITSSLVVSGVVNTVFNYQIGAAYSPTNYSASSLPAWLSIDTLAGVISGTPTLTGVTGVPIAARNAAGTTNATLVITIPNINPTVNAGADQTVQLTESMTLSGTGSDAGGSIVSWQWTKLSGPAATIVSPTNAITQVTGFVSGDYVFRLTVTDNQGATVVDDVSVNVPEPAAPRTRSCGANSYGQSGDGSTAAHYTPLDCTDLFNVMSISAGYYHSVAVKSDNTVWTWGYNAYGQLGSGDTANQYSPTRVGSLSGFKTVAAGSYHSLAAKTNGTVWAWGFNSYGQLGDGSVNQSATPVQVSGLSGITNVAAGGYHSLALKTNGTLWAWGLNDKGQLGDGTVTNRKTAVQVLNLSNVTAIAAGATFNLALKSDGTVWAWGNNSNGQLGDGTISNRSAPVQVSGLSGVTAIGAGSGHSLAIMSNGTLWAWGYNGYGQLGIGTNDYNPHSTPVQVTSLTGTVLRVSSGCSSTHSLAVMSNGTAFAWGKNSTGQLGDGTNITPRTLPVPVSGLADGVVSAVAAGSDYSLFVLTPSGNGSPGTLQFSASTYSAGESAGTATVTVTRTGGGTGAVSVNYSASAGTATAGSDFTATNGTLAWAAGDTSARTFSVAILEDALVESSETVNLTLAGPAGGATLGSPATVTLTIADNDVAAVAPAITVQPTNLTVFTAQTATFTVTASGTAPLFYQWMQSGTDISGATASSYTVPATVSGDNGAFFSVVVTNSAGSVTSAVAVLTVCERPVPASWITQCGVATGNVDNLTYSEYLALLRRDSDGDGMPDWQEYLAGTDPTNSQSVFAVSSISMQGGSNLLLWQTRPGSAAVPYTVERRTNLASGIWQVLDSQVPRTAPTNMWWDTNPAPFSLNYYRISVTNSLGL